MGEKYLVDILGYGRMAEINDGTVSFYSRRMRVQDYTSSVRQYRDKASLALKIPKR